MGELSPGSLFAGHRIEAVAGRGGMGVVYRAVQLSLDRTVALKVIAPALMQDAAIRRRFMRESKVAASIDHPHVIPIYYTGEEDGVAFIAMRYVAGDDLRTLVRRGGPLSPQRVAGIVAQVGAALDAAHAAGLVHRDVKPANVLLGPEDHVYLTDFGLTKGEISEGATRPGHWVGTLDFVAPEQIRGERIDARADVYGLGCLLYYALTGRPPFARDNDEAKLWAHLSEPPPAVSENGTGTAFDGVVARALAKSPDERYPSAGDLGRAAVAAATGDIVTEHERVVAVGAAAPIEVETRTAMRPTTTLPAPAPRGRAARATGRRRALLRGLAVAVVLLGLGTAAGYALQMDDDRRTPEPTPTPTPRPGGTAPRVDSVRVGGRLNAVAVAGGRVWTGEFRGPNLHAVDPDSLRRLMRLRATVGVGLEGLAVSGRSLWAVLSRDHQVVQIDARTGRRLRGPYPLPADANASAVVATPTSVWVATTTPELDPGDQIVHLDPDTGEIRETINVVDGVRRLAITGGGLWLLASQPARLIRIDLRTRKRDHYRLESMASGDLAVGLGHLWVTLVDADILERFDPRTGDSATVAVGRSPAGIAIHGGSVWVANRSSSTLTRVDAASLRARDEIQVPINPYELATDGEAIWVSTLADGVLARVRVPR